MEVSVETGDVSKIGKDVCEVGNIILEEGGHKNGGIIRIKRLAKVSSFAGKAAQPPLGGGDLNDAL
jgi:hypothetical protein